MREKIEGTEGEMRIYNVHVWLDCILEACFFFDAFSSVM